MSEITIVKINDKNDFPAVAKAFGVEIGSRGALPKRALLLKVREAVKAGTAELVETPFFGVDAVLATATPVKRATLAWVITYRVTDPETKVQGEPVSLVITGEQIKSVLPDASLQGRSLSGVIALVMIGWKEGLSISELRNYVVTAVVRVEDDAVTTEDAPKGDDTGEQSSDADKAPETVKDVPPVEEITPEIKTPELVPAESAPVTPAKRTRKPAAKK